MSYVIQITGRGERTLNPAQRAALDPRKLNATVANASRTEFRRHLLEANRSRPNALGGTRTNFYQKAAGATVARYDADGVTITVGQLGFRQRVLGGTIRPRKSKYLTIPAHADAHGKRAGEFSDLHPIYNRTGQPIALARGLAGSAVSLGANRGNRRRQGASQDAFQILFWLRKSVTQKPDPSLIPSEQKLGTVINRNINAQLKRAAAK